MAFDWVNFFRQYNIEFVETGPNVSRGNVNIRCPFCGPNDPSHHLGVNLDGNGWGCWRSAEHRGGSPARLVQALIHCSREKAQQIVGESTFLPEDFMGQVTKNMSKPMKAFNRGKLSVPPEFKALSRTLPSCRPFIRYLENRGFGSRQIDLLSTNYDIMYCTRGPYKGRIIFLVYYEGELVSWTGRTIYPSEPVRYKTLTTDPEKAEREGTPLAVGPITDYLLWNDKILKRVQDASQFRPDTLFVVEGPFDALWVSIIGRRIGVAATCLFTTSISQSQIASLQSLGQMFTHRYIMLDAEMFPKALSISWQHQSLNLLAKSLPDGVGDPAELTKKQLSLILK